MSVNLLYWGRSWAHLSRAGRRSFEYHPYCQLEVCVSGTVIVKLKEQDFVLHAGDFLLMPGGVEHSVYYPDSDNEFYSLKFEAPDCGEKPLFAAKCRFNNWCISSFAFCHAADARYALPIDATTREIVEGLLELWLRHFTTDRQEEANEPPIFGRIRQAVLRNGAALSVEDCAAMLKMNAAQLNYQFRKELELYNLSTRVYSVKKVIDQALLNQIDRYLDFTTLPLGTIAQQLKFNNVYTFSRFYKRLTGVSPKAHRSGRE